MILHTFVISLRKYYSMCGIWLIFSPEQFVQCPIVFVSDL